MVQFRMLTKPRWVVAICPGGLLFVDGLKQREILNRIAPDFARDGEKGYIQRAKERILEFVEVYTKSAHADGYVIGISGGIDSFLVGALLAENCQRTGRELVAVLLPNGMQADISDARDCAARIAEIYPKTCIEEINIGATYEQSVATLSGCAAFHSNPYSLGNLQPRLRMLFQYALSQGKLVAGTDQASEAVTGFYTKYGDGGTDFNPIGQLIKDDIYAMSAELGAPEAVLRKKPAAGLGISADDESELRLSYADICAYLKGMPIDADAEKRLIHLYDASMHKRAVPPTPAWLHRDQEQVTHLCVGDTTDTTESIRYLNEHPMEEVLYVNVNRTDPFISKVYKTVNTPIARYNCFTGDRSPVNGQFGSLFDNVRPLVRISGDMQMAKNIVNGLEDRGCVLELLG